MDWEDKTLGAEPDNGIVTVESFVYDYEEENGRTYHSYSQGGTY